VGTADDYSGGELRLEIVDAASGAHLGHRFGSRECVNAATLLLVPPNQPTPARLPGPAAPALTALLRDEPCWLGKARVVTLAGGCFWRLRATFAAQPGVLRALAGFTGGSIDRPSYEQVCAGGTGHVEAVQLAYDPAQTSYETLLDVFWDSHDPCSLYRQGADSGAQYSPRIVFHSEAQQCAANESRQRLRARLLSSGGGDVVVTPVLPATGPFWEAGPEHQQRSRGS